MQQNFLLSNPLLVSLTTCVPPNAGPGGVRLWKAHWQHGPILCGLDAQPQQPTPAPRHHGRRSVWAARVQGSAGATAAAGQGLAGVGSGELHERLKGREGWVCPLARETGSREPGAEIEVHGKLLSKGACKEACFLGTQRGGAPASTR